MIEYHGVRFKAVAKKIRQALKDLSPNPLTWIGLLDELWSIVEDYIEFAKTTYEALEKCVMLIVEMGKLCLESVDQLKACLDWRTRS